MRGTPVDLTAFRPVPRTGVIFVTAEAAAAGFVPGDPAWANLGQGMPETGALEGAPPRLGAVEVDGGDLEYAPIAGIPELREAVASLYNTLYRRGMPSQYGPENVAIAGGGRAALTRAVAALGEVNLGHFLPDYTAYEELLDLFRTFTPIPILLDPGQGYAFPVDTLRKEILGMGLGAILLSNPSNPTGKVIRTGELAGWVEAARDLDCALVLDEFYSHYIWTGSGETPAPPVSAAAYVEDVERDPVIVVGGLTKDLRYPGLRVSWTLGPRTVIEAMASAGSFLDGGGSRPIQRAAIDLVSPENVAAEHAAVYRAFSRKRAMMLEGLERLGITVDRYPEGTFYVWGNLAGLPGELAEGMALFRAALAEKVIVVPGEFFDVNPGRRRPGRASRFRSHVRFSFGPEEAQVRRGLEGLARVLGR